MNVRIESSGELTVGYLFGEIDHHTAPEIREALDMEICRHHPQHCILDFNQVTFMDSAGIGLVMGRYRLLNSRKASLEIRNVSLQTKKLMELAGLSAIAIIKVKER